MRVSIPARILIAVMFLAAGIIVAAYVVTRESLESADVGRGNFLKKHFDCYEAYRAGVGEAIAAAATFCAEDPQLQAALAAQDETAARAVIERLERALRDNLQADFVVLSIARGSPSASAARASSPPKTSVAAPSSSARARPRSRASSSS